MACEHFGPTCLYCRQDAPYILLPYIQIGQARIGDGDKAKTKVQKSLIDFEPPKQDNDKETDQQTDIGKVTDVDDHTLSKSDF